MPPAPVPVPAPIKVPQVFAQALELHKQGRLADAEQLYSEVLAHRPDHFDALQMLSVVKLAKGQPAEVLAPHFRGDAHAQTLPANSGQPRNDPACA